VLVATAARSWRGEDDDVAQKPQQQADTGATTDYDNTRVGMHPRLLTAAHDRMARRRWVRQCPRDPPGIPAEAILAGKRDSGVTGKEDTITTSNPVSHP